MSESLARRVLRRGLEKGGAVVARWLVPAAQALIGARPESWRARQVQVLLDDLYWLPAGWLLGRGVGFADVRREMDRQAGKVIKLKYGQGYRKHSVIDGRVELMPTQETAARIFAEMNDILAGYQFASVLEVGAGELTTLFAVAQRFGPGITYAGIDLSPRGLAAGRDYFGPRGFGATLAAANAVALPFADASFDLVYTAGCLPQMPPAIARQALAEMARVGRGALVLFEPDFALGGLLQRNRMRRAGYLRDIPSQIAAVPGLALIRRTPLRHHINPLDQVSCFALTADRGQRPAAAPELRCPLCRGGLEARGDALACPACGRAYPAWQGIPILDPDLPPPA